MLGGLFRALVLIVVLVAAGTFLLGWWGGGRFRSAESTPGAVGTIGVTKERAREVGADIGQRTAVAADQARRGLNEAGITTKIKAKMALDDTVKALSVNVDTTGSTVTVTGTVDTPAQKARVLQLARETDGVREVIDRVRVKE
jgi:hyperosmotically inducible protein